MKKIAQEQKYILLTAPVRRGRNKRQTAGCDEGKAFPLLIQLIYLYLEKIAGGLASSALSYGLTGEATFNVLNIADFGSSASCGLLEVSVGNNGIKTRLGTGGTDISAGTLISAYNGIKESSKVLSWKYGSIEKRSTLNSINMMGYTKNETAIRASKDVWDEKLKVEYGDTGKDYGNYTIGDDKIRLSTARR